MRSIVWLVYCGYVLLAGPYRSEDACEREVHVSTSVATTRSPLSPRKTGRPSLDDAQSLTNRIVDVATHLFLSDGFEATSLEKIAKEAGVSKRTLYSRFDSKSELFKAVVARYTTRNAAAIVPLQHPSATNVERLTHICIETLGFCLNASVIALERVMMAEVERFPELALVVNDYATAHLKEPLRQVLQDGMASGEIIVADVNEIADLLCDSLIISHLRKTALGLEPPGITDEKRLEIARRVELMFRGLGPHRP